MRLLAVFLLVGSILFVSFKAGNKEIKFHILGQITGLKDDSIFLLIRDRSAKGSTAKVDTVSTVSRNGRFELWGKAGRVMFSTVSLSTKGRKYFSLFLEDGDISVKGHIDSVEKLRITGTPENEIYTAAILHEYIFYDSMNASYAQLRALTDKKSPAATALTAHADRMRDSVQQFWVDFTASHPDALTSGLFMYLLQDRITLEKLEPLYNNLTDKVKNSDFGPGVKEKIIARKRTMIGSAAPHFAVNDIDGKPITPEAYSGRYLLLDFWASWCVPCREENPALKAAYKKYKDKGFAIVSVSVDNDIQKWKEAIIKDTLTWRHACEAMGTGEGVAKLYGVQPIPDNFLISPGGKIIGRGLRGDELDKSLAQYLK